MGARSWKKIKNQSTYTFHFLSNFILFYFILFILLYIYIYFYIIFQYLKKNSCSFLLFLEMENILFTFFMRHGRHHVARRSVGACTGA